LSLALGHIPSTALPGQSGNVGVAGHRDTLFRALKEIRNKDLIRFETLAGNHVYQVDSTRIVKPEDVGVLKPGKTPELTLVTCYPFYFIGSAPERFIVSAHEVPGEPTSEVTNVSPERTPEIPPATIPITAPAGPTATPRLIATAASTHPTTTSFNVRKGHGQEVAPGISFGVTDTDARDGRVYGWLWLMPDRRTIMLRDQAAGDPLVFTQDGKRRELLITSVSENAVGGSLLLPAE
jgi:LPXTG-site transpeptidase (sortase) family protein